MEELIKKIKEIDKKIKDYEEENKKYMSKGEMEYIREKCTNNKPISVSELTRYSKILRFILSPNHIIYP